jgi:sugar O-acyltransferase (sialic acid O-acetyltransferase NeuD family)
MSVIVLCSGGHARVVIEALLSRGTRPVAVTDRDSARVGTSLGGIPIMGTDEDILKMTIDSVELANGLGNLASRSDSGLSARRDLFQRFAKLGYRFPVISHAAAVIASDASLGEGVQVMAGAIVQPAARVGRNVLINTRAVVEHDCQVGDHAHIAPCALLCGAVSVGEGAHVGAGAVVLGGVCVGAGSIVAAGAVVAKDVAAGAFVGRERDSAR